MTRKQMSRVEVKDADAGLVSAVVATFDVVDHDGDVTLKGAFPDGVEVPISAYNHASWEGSLPVGKGTFRSTSTEAIFEGQFFLDTTAGRDTFAVVKHLGSLGQWSYGYEPVKHSRGERDGKSVRVLEQLKVHEASPVLLGAGINTRTLDTKKFSDEAQAVLADLTALTDRAADILVKRQEKGKGLGAESAELLSLVEAELKRFADLLATPAIEEPDFRAAVEAEYLRLLAHSLR